MMITKSLFLNYKVCPKNFWLSVYKKDVATPASELDKKNIETGIKLGEYARTYFEDTYLAARFSEDGKADYAAQVLATKDALIRNHHVIAEASFRFEDLFCAVDLLVQESGGWSIYEVKASTEYKTEHLFDAAFQCYVLRKSGINVNNCYIMHLNKTYRREGDINVHQLFEIENISNHDDFIATLADIDDDLLEIREIASSKKEWVVPFSKACKDCLFHDYCTSILPKNNISTINGIRAEVAYQLINQGIVTAHDYVSNGKRFKNPRQQVQLESMIKDTGFYVNRQGLTQFLNSLHYPLYHLDFETMNEGIPPFDHAYPYEQIPFQYSLHVETFKGKEYIHKEFLGHTLDCRRELAKQLCEDIPFGGNSIAYNASFEKTVLTQLSELFPDLKNHLLSIRDNMIDLKIPFAKAYYYDPKQKGSNSLKDVMPALCPHMEEAYHKLPVVHNGGEALAMFPKLMNMVGSEYDYVRRGMLAYCELDTLATVEVLKVLYKAVA